MSRSSDGVYPVSFPQAAQARGSQSQIRLIKLQSVEEVSKFGSSSQREKLVDCEIGLVQAIAKLFIRYDRKKRNAVSFVQSSPSWSSPRFTSAL